ncbi:hypothetical protein F5878DRAFT_647206 [Lentinula raphanica]|uniref:Uncharacterized protein n=1 Tax=Lentinula raphanica TaxID=153919 RepID=A0AA38NWJ4_9AGAR|nr:hypothetical protein F5878DRAFT_647206 [Lentinula raphanica]
MNFTTTQADVKKIAEKVLSLVEDGTYPASVKGMVIGSGCKAPLLVPVPVDTLDASTALKYTFSFFFERANTPTGANSLLTATASAYNNHSLPSLHGNIVVVKHNRHGTVDMKSIDWTLVKVILEWLVNNRQRYMDVAPEIFKTPRTLCRPVIPSDIDINQQSDESQASVDIDHPLFHTPTIRNSIFEYSSTPALIKLAGTCSSMRSWVHKFYRARVIRMLSKGFDIKKHAKFLDLLDDYQGKIGGSAAYCVVDASAPFTFNDINVLVPYGKGEALYAELINQFGWHSNHIVRKQNLWQYFTNRTCRLFNSREWPVPQAIVHKLQKRWTLLATTEHMGRPCNETCPQLWRRTLGHRWCAVIDWGGFRRGGDNSMEWGSYEWKIGYDCHNPFCVNSPPVEMCRWDESD